MPRTVAFAAREELAPTRCLTAAFRLTKLTDPTPLRKGVARPPLNGWSLLDGV